MAKREKLVQILYNGHASIQAETEPRQQSWGFQAPFQQLLVIAMFRQLHWMSELSLSEEALQLLQLPWLGTASEQDLGQLCQQYGQQVWQPEWRVPERDSQNGADWMQSA